MNRIVWESFRDRLKTRRDRDGYRRFHIEFCVAADDEAAAEELLNALVDACLAQPGIRGFDWGTFSENGCEECQGPGAPS